MKFCWQFDATLKWPPKENGKVAEAEIIGTAISNDGAICW